jgi:hypothetical protein
MDFDSEHPKRTLDTFSEKYDENLDSAVEVEEPIVDGDVYADVRAIDLDEDGNERPIGTSSRHYQ